MSGAWKKISVIVSPAAKAGALLSSAAIFATATSVQGQACDSFHMAAESNPIGAYQSYFSNMGKPAFVDIDGDGDLDCYQEHFDEGNSHPAQVFFLRNNGTKEIPYYQPDTLSGFPTSFSFPLGLFASDVDGPKFADVDNDGDYDCLLGAYGSWDAVVRYFENTGSPTKPVFTERTGKDNPFNFVLGYYGLRYTLADLDSDGDFDLVTSVSYRQVFYKNEGTAQKPSFKQYSEEYSLFACPFTFYDWNKDELLNRFSDINVYYQNTGTAKKPVFTISEEGGPILPPDMPGYIVQFTDLNSDGFPEIFDAYSNMITTAPDAYIRYDSTRSNTLHAYPRNGDYKYRWQRNGKAIAGATGANYTPVKPGTYTVKVLSTCGTGVSVPVPVSVILKPSFDNFIAQNSITGLSGNEVKAYPNPFTNSFVLELNSKTDLSKTIIRITDIEGRVVERLKPSRSVVNLGAKLAKGVFVVHVIHEEGIMYTQKIVKE